MTRKTHRSKSHKRRHTRKRGGACACSMRGQWGGRGGLGGAEVGHAFTTGASQTLYQMTGQTPGLSSGGAKGSKARARTRAATLARRAEGRAQRANQMANRAENMAEEAQNLAEEAAAAARGVRLGAPEFVPSRNVLNQVALDRGLDAKEAELLRLVRFQNEENSNNFNNLMRKIHKKRMNNND
jgi:hypothetical protein